MVIVNIIKGWINPENYSIDAFMKFVSKNIKKGDKILDAGAGGCPYMKYFLKADYESTDIHQPTGKIYKTKHDFLCNLDNIPKKNNSYDVVINTQVLEHVENPEKVIKELYRILKPRGKLFLTAPQGWRVHGSPYHFFNFTKHGLELLFKKAGFKTINIKPRGGIFWYLSVLIRDMPRYIVNQNKFFLPFYILLMPLCEYLIPLIFFSLDKLDKEKVYTLGYSCYCVK